MITFENVLHPDGSRSTFTVPGTISETQDGSHLLALPGLIDPHVHFRTPGLMHKENWVTASRAAICGGYTTVFDMPNTLPPTITAHALAQKKQLIDAQLQEAGIPLRYELFFGADKTHLAEIPLVRSAVAGIKVFMGCSTGNLVIDDDESLAAVFELAAQNDLTVAVHAEDEAMMAERKKQAGQLNGQDYARHSDIRNPEVAARAVEKAVSLVKKYKNRLYVLHVSTAEEIDLIRQAKQENLPVYAETTPHHVFLDDSAYGRIGGKAVVNPPLRTRQQREAVLSAIQAGVIDTIGSDHAPHTSAEKQKPYGECPSGMPGIETTLPLLLTACQDGLLTLEKVISLTCDMPRTIFRVSENEDWVLVDMKNERVVREEALATRCRWSAFSGRRLKGWPVVVRLRDEFFKLV